MGRTEEIDYGDGVFVLLYVRLLNVDALCSGLSPLQGAEKLKSLIGRCESIIRSTRGMIYQYVGDNLLAFWDSCEVYNNMDYWRLTCELIDLDDYYNDLRSSRLSVALVKGNCAYERRGGAYSRIIGGPVSRVLAISSKWGDKGGSIVVDESLNGDWNGCGLLPNGDGTYIYRFGPES